ncbi:MAG: NitT/TauT family transport system substrate-binding protein [Clostridiales bacterium]|jgi:NitT/TauT family transport system substrate-binding protein|nr:NitT/TauT family transport system substrate-binding protein [Clostridiales bacterium]
MKKSITTLLAIIMTLALVLTGCSGGTTTTAAATTVAAETTTAAAAETTGAAELETVRLQLKWLPQAQFMGYYVAAEKGYYAEEGIEVEILPGGPDIVPESQVASGAADIGVGWVSTLMPFEEQGYPLVEIAQIFQHSALQLVYFNSQNISTPADLAGKTIGSWMGGHEYEIYALLAKYGLDKDKDVTIAKQDFTMDAFLNGTLDVASAMTYNEYMVVVESGVPESDLSVIDMNKEGVAMLEDCLFTNTEWLADNEDLAARFLRASIKGWADAVADPEAAAEIVFALVDQSSTTLEHQVNMANKVAEAVAPEGFDTSKIGYIDPDAIAQTAEIAKTYGVITEVPETIFMTDVWDAATK